MYSGLFHKNYLLFKLFIHTYKKKKKKKKVKKEKRRGFRPTISPDIFKMIIRAGTWSPAAKGRKVLGQSPLIQ